MTVSAATEATPSKTHDREYLAAIIEAAESLKRVERFFEGRTFEEFGFSPDAAGTNRFHECQLWELENLLKNELYDAMMAQREESPERTTHE